DMVFRQQEPAFVRVSGWQVETIPSITHSTNLVSTYKITRRVETILQRVQKWVPTANLSRGLVTVPGLTLDFPAATWSHGKLNVTTSWPEIAALSNSPLVRLVLTNRPGLTARGLPRINVAANLLKAPYQADLISEPLRL